MSTMSLTAGTNRWASRVVIALQLAAWSAVGIVLLQKGVASLQKNPNTGNVPEKITQLSRAQVTDHGFGNLLRIGKPTSTESELRLSVIPLESDETVTLENKNEEAEPNEKSLPKERRKDASKSPTDFAVTVREIPSDSRNDDRQLSNINKSDSDRRINNSVVNKIEQFNKKNEFISDDHGDKVTTVKDKTRGDKDASNKQEKSADNDKTVLSNNEKNNQENVTTYRSVTENSNTKVTEESGFATRSEEETRWENRRRLRIMKLNAAGGTAAAIAMVAVGAVMLVLGPAVIVLRALDERRQERRFLKLSGEEDLPPSYEQATDCCDQAPTYSSLNLDTLVDPLPPPPSPLPSPTTRHSAHL